MVLFYGGTLVLDGDLSVGELTSFILYTLGIISRLALRGQGLGAGVQGSGFRVQGSGSRVQGPGFRVQGSGFRVQGQGSGCRVQDSGFRVQTTLVLDGELSVGELTVFILYTLGEILNPTP